MSAVAAKALGDTSAFHAIFFEEADEHLSAVEGLLLALDPAAPNAEALNGIFRAVQMLQCPWQAVWARFSQAPAELMGLRNELAVGQPADFCVLKVNDRNELVELRVF